MPKEFRLFTVMAVTVALFFAGLLAGSQRNERERDQLGETLQSVTSASDAQSTEYALKIAQLARELEGVRAELRSARAELEAARNAPPAVDPASLEQGSDPSQPAPAPAAQPVSRPAPAPAPAPVRAPARAPAPANDSQEKSGKDHGEKRFENRGPGKNKND